MSLKKEYYEKKMVNQGRYVYKKNIANSEIKTLNSK